MKTVNVRNIEIGAGKPKICVPIVGITREDILSEAKAILTVEADVVEWRADWFEGALDAEKTVEMLKELREVLPYMPILYTFRTADEGGEKAVSSEDYAGLCKAVSESKLADLIDVEIFRGDQLVSGIIEKAHECGVYVIASNHDFHKTPDCEDIVSRLRKMQDMNADICKIAVMPTCKKDVLTLLMATEEMSSVYADRPIITMSMSGMGVISRICGECFGSALTFGAVKKASAPGQMNCQDLSQVLELLHKAL